MADKGIILSGIAAVVLIGLTIWLESKEDTPKEEEPITKEGPAEEKTFEPMPDLPAETKKSPKIREIKCFEDAEAPKTEFDRFMVEQRKQRDRRKRRLKTDNQVRKQSVRDFAERVHRANMEQNR